MTAAIIIGIGLTLLLAAGIALLLLGLRGRRINDHPICRGCGFDLVGVLPARTICPECGADVANGRRVRDGARRRLHGTAIVGAAIALVAIAPLGFVAWGWAFAVDLNPFKPTPLLVWESGYAGPTTIDPILSELNTRWTAGSLSPAQKAALIGRALDAQADTARPWSEGWGDLFDLAVVEDLPTEAERIRFESHSAIPALRVAAECQPDERIHFYIPASEYRQSATGRAHLKVHVLDTLLGQSQLERMPSTISGGRRPAILGVVSMASE
jgi:hypothetical protein